MINNITYIQTARHPTIGRSSRGIANVNKSNLYFQKGNLHTTSINKIKVAILQYKNTPLQVKARQ